jgi:hypothetical protein
VGGCDPRNPATDNGNSTHVGGTLGGAFWIIHELCSVYDLLIEQSRGKQASTLIAGAAGFELPNSTRLLVT